MRATTARHERRLTPHHPLARAGCGHCKRLVPEFKKLGAAVAKDPKLKNRVVVAKVDADKHRELGERFGVRGFPTLKWFSRGNIINPDE